ncbi:hypothetical protein DPMN_059730 [Dreissena polymorpha]|uniref:Uncharacterized protein n=1 Tax=Dreissena polymorpha TaxID=45954 RepID=A0A9D4C404_DREPO|nr:hypothetical protein DPMN_059730 [Dreissena polymorpha]
MSRLLFLCVLLASAMILVSAVNTYYGDIMGRSFGADGARFGGGSESAGDASDFFRRVRTTDNE